MIKQVLSSHGVVWLIPVAGLYPARAVFFRSRERWEGSCVTGWPLSEVLKQTSPVPLFEAPNAAAALAAANLGAAGDVGTVLAAFQPNCLPTKEKNRDVFILFLFLVKKK